jgi:hypothetical protein
MSRGDSGLEEAGETYRLARNILVSSISPWTSALDRYVAEIEKEKEEEAAKQKKERGGTSASGQ